MTPAYLTLVGVALLALLTSILIHRYVALCTLAGGGVSVAYFFMEPVYSLRVADIPDLVVLGAYSLFGIMLTIIPRKKQRAGRPGNSEIAPGEQAFAQQPQFGVRAGIEQAVEAYGTRLRHSGLVIEASGLPDMPIGKKDALFGIFSDLIERTLAIEGAQHVTVNFGLTPETLRVYWVVRTRAMPSRYLMSTGKGDAMSEPMDCPRWPPGVEMTAIRNACQVIHQISFRR